MQPMDGLTPEERADLALLMQANEHGGFAIEVGSNKHQALNRAIENEWVRLVEIDPQECEAAARVQAHRLRPLALVSSVPCVAAAA